MFRRPTIRYGQTPEPTTPYQRAAQAWDDRIGSARVQAKNWRLAFFGSLALSGGLAGGLIWQSARGHIVPWVVQVDRLGEAQAVKLAWKPSTSVDVSADDAGSLMKLIDTLEDDDDVQTVWGNYEISDEVAESLA